MFLQYILVDVPSNIWEMVLHIEKARNFASYFKPCYRHLNPEIMYVRRVRASMSYRHQSFDFSYHPIMGSKKRIYKARKLLVFCTRGLARHFTK